MGSKNRNFVIRRKYSEILERMPSDEKGQNDIANDLIEWALKEDSILLERFPLSKMMSPYLFFRLAKSGKNPYFTESVEFARALCCVRMQEGNHKIDTGLIYRLLPIYHHEYAQYLLEKETRTMEYNKNNSSTIVVQMEPSKSDVVPICTTD